VKTFTITASAGTGGSITWPSGVTTFPIGSSQTYTITPTAGYHITDVQVDGASVGLVTTYTFTNITANHTIAATFGLNPSYTITASAGANGAISPSGSVSVLGGTGQTFTMTPNAGYRVADVQVDGASVGPLTSYTFSSVQAAHTINATFTLDVYTLTASADVNGSISPVGTLTVNKGASQTYTITPNAGYDVQNVIVDGASKGAVTSYTFSNITANHTINAYFKVTTYTITASGGSGGSISPVGITTLNIGGSQAYTITPTAGYHINDVQVDGASAGAVTTYTFTNVTANHTIVAIFGANPSYTITVSAGANGAISPGTVSVLGGTNQTFTITPNAGYRVVDVQVDGSSVGPLTVYTFANIAGNHSISATFTLILYFNISASAGPNGSISPTGTASVQQFTNQTYTMTPNAGYRVADVQVDGASVGALTSYTFSNVQAAHTINATFTLDVYTLTASADVNGSITPSGTITVNKGSSQTYTITPNQGYQVLNVIVDGSSKGAVTSYTFTNVTANHTINAYFKAITYTITASAGTGGSISPTGTVTVNIGGSQTFTITPTSGYTITDVQVDGASAGAVTTYSFTNVTANHTIAATFGTNPSYAITASAGANGSISPTGTVTVLGGASQKFTITAAAGYRVADVQVDGASVGAVTSYTFTNVQASHTINATFTLNVYTITAAADVTGSITPSGTVTVNKGASQTFTITPNQGYQVRSVIVDGANKGAVTSYTFTNVTANHTINAYFK